MKLQKETKKEPRQTSRLNRLVFSVALLWLATSLLLLLMYHSGPAHAVQPNRASQEQKLALVAPPAAANASFTY
jgi:preprotein translocase subunit SecG